MGKPRRLVQATAEATMTPPDALEARQSIARVAKAEASNLHLCTLPSGKSVVVELADRFRKTFWIKRGDFVLVEVYESDERGDRIQGEIVNIVRDLRAWRKMPYW